MIFDWNSAAQELGFSDEKAMWEDLYVKREKTIKQLAAVFQTGTSTIVRRMDALGIDKRARGGANNIGDGWKLFFIDQRLLFNLSESEVGKLLRVHTTTVYRFKKQLTWRIP